MFHGYILGSRSIVCREGFVLEVLRVSALQCCVMRTICVPLEYNIQYTARRTTSGLLCEVVCKAYNANEVYLYFIITIESTVQCTAYNICCVVVMGAYAVCINIDIRDGMIGCSRLNSALHFTSNGDKTDLSSTGSLQNPRKTFQDRFLCELEYCSGALSLQLLSP